MPSSKLINRQANEIAAMLAGHAEHCSACNAVILLGAPCMHCSTTRLLAQVMDLERQLDRACREPQWPQGKITINPYRWDTTTIHTGDTT